MKKQHPAPRRAAGHAPGPLPTGNFGSGPLPTGNFGSGPARRLAPSQPRTKPIEDKIYRSQIGQDVYVNNTYVKNNKNGIFVDVGAFDGVKLSNTHFFEKQLNWTGICVEPQKKEFLRLKKNRTCICINAAAFNIKTTVDFRVCNKKKMLNGIANHHNTKHRMKGEKISIIKVPTVTLKDVFEENDITTVDYMSIDTEGSELQVLQGIDWNKVHINIINLEHNFDKKMLEKEKTFLLSKNFVLDRLMNHDVFFRNESLKWSWNVT